MKRILQILVALLIVSCGVESSNPSKDKNEYCEFVKPPFVFLRELLVNPIDLETYKEKFQPIDNKRVEGCALFDIPDTIGFVYQYKNFSTLKSELKNDLKNDQIKNGLRITVIKFGEDSDAIEKRPEKLIAIESSIDNTTLNDLNVYGKTREEIQKLFGRENYTAENQIIYQSDNNALSIHFNSTKADWFKFVRMNENSSLEDSIPEFLLKYDEYKY